MNDGKVVYMIPGSGICDAQGRPFTMPDDWQVNGPRLEVALDGLPNPCATITPPGPRFSRETVRNLLGSTLRAFNRRPR